MKRIKDGALVLAVCALSLSCHGKKPDAQEVLALTQKVADWQLATFDEHHKYRGIPEKWKSRDKAYQPYNDLEWHMGALYAGWYEWYKVSGDEKIKDFLLEIGERNDWSLQKKGSSNPYYADGHAVGHFYLSLYQEEQQPDMIAPTQERFDWIMANPKTGSLEWSGWGADKYRTDCHYRWGWCDALFMAPPVWARLAKVTGERKYLEFMDQEYRATYDLLWDKEDLLFWRDSSYFEQREKNGQKVFWSRGNGWVFGGLALMIPDLPEKWERKASYVKLFEAMAESIKNCQREDGSWSMGMLGDVKDYPEMESSGTAFFTFGLAWGINNGLLDRATYEPVVFKAWNALAQCVNDEGMLGFVQPVGASPGQSFADKSEVYGVGAFLAAGAEVYKLVAAMPQGTLLFEEGFESGVYSLKNSGNAPEVVEVKDARAGNYVLKSQITPARENKYRTETSLNYNGLNFDVGKEYWVGMSIKLGTDYDDAADFDDQGMLMQWHYRDWRHPDVRDAQPLLLRYVGNGKVIVDNEVLGREGTGSRTLAKMEVPFGEWVDWVLHYKINDKDGIIQVWRNGELVVDWTGDNHQIEKHDGAYLKFGLYSAQFKPDRKRPVSMPSGSSRTVYHDEVRIAGADGSYYLVAPRDR